jgi:hypothetical protein
MAEVTPVPYPSAGFAYPVARPVPAFAPAQRLESAVETEPKAEAEIALPALPESSGQTAAEPPKFFPLVPTKTSKFVSTSEPVVQNVVAPKVEQETAQLVAPVDESKSLSVEPEIAETSEQLESPFNISSSLNREPQTNSIVLDQIPDALTAGEIFTDAGQILNTGSIELPTLTGEVNIVSDSPDADRADLLDSASVTISTVAPVRAPSVINSKAQLGVLPSKKRRNQGQLMAMLTLSILIVTVGTLYAMAAILGIVK